MADLQTILEGAADDDEAPYTQTEIKKAAAPMGAQKELAKAAGDAAYFCTKFCQIEDVQGHGEGTGRMPFTLWPAQMPVMWALMTERLLIILKARQLGISWLCCAYALWLCVFSPGKMVLCFSQGQEEANELIRRIRAMFDLLPDWMKPSLPRLLKGNTEQLLWSNGSRVMSLPATEKAGRSFTASLVLMDEAAFMAWADSLYTALKPTIDAGGQLVVCSTANGIGGLFHKLWTDAVAGVNNFKTIFLPWWSRPGRTKSWYRKMLAESPDPIKVYQEYPATSVEAFIASGRARFAAAWIQQAAENVEKPMGLAAMCPPLRDIHARIGAGYNRLLIYRNPEPGRSYLIAADPAGGESDSDFSAAVVLDRQSWEEVGCLHGKWEPDSFAVHLAHLGRIFQNAEIVPERNNHGHAVLAALKREGYSKIGLGEDEKPGWNTSGKSKPQMIDTLAECLRDALCSVRTQSALDEMQIYQVLDNGTTGSPSGFHDDLVMAWAIALSVARRPIVYVNPLLAPAELAVGFRRAGRR